MTAPNRPATLHDAVAEHMAKQEAEQAAAQQRFRDQMAADVADAAADPLLNLRPEGELRYLAAAYNKTRHGGDAA